jgi:hypothetical protein
LAYDELLCCIDEYGHEPSVGTDNCKRWDAAEDVDKTMTCINDYFLRMGVFSTAVSESPFLQKLQTCEALVHNMNILQIIDVHRLKVDPSKRFSTYTVLQSEKCIDAWSTRTREIIKQFSDNNIVSLQQSFIGFLNNAQTNPSSHQSLFVAMQ